MGARALAFALGLSSVCGLVFGLAPAWQAARFDAGSALKQEGRGGSAAGRKPPLALFAAAEIPLALILLVRAGLLLATFRNLPQVDPGVDPSNRVTPPAHFPQ